MITYWAVLAYISILGVLFGNMQERPQAKRIFLLLAFAVLVLVMGFRSASVGIDTHAYCSFYEAIGISSDYLNIVNSAPVYSVLNKILYSISSDPQTFIMFASIITGFGVAYFIYHFSENVAFSTFLYVSLYFYLNSFNGMRQGMAASLCLVAFVLVAKKKRVLIASVVLLCAIGIHNTCLVFVPFVFLGLLEISNKAFVRVIWLVSAMAIGIFFFFDQIMSVFVKVFPGYIQYLDALTNEAFAASGRNIVQTAFFAVILIVYYRTCIRDKDNQIGRVLFLPAVFGVALSFTFYHNYLIGARIPLYLTVMIIILTPNSLTTLGRGKQLFGAIVICSSLALMFFLLSGNYAGVVPYETRVWV